MHLHTTAKATTEHRSEWRMVCNKMKVINIKKKENENEIQENGKEIVFTLAFFAGACFA